jgi:hypothetical protein
VTDGFSYLSFSAETMDMDYHHSCRVDRLVESADFELVVVCKKKTNKREKPPKSRARAYP